MLHLIVRKLLAHSIFFLQCADRLSATARSGWNHRVCTSKLFRGPCTGKSEREPSVGARPRFLFMPANPENLQKETEHESKFSCLCAVMPVPEMFHARLTPAAVASKQADELIQQGNDAIAK